MVDAAVSSDETVGMDASQSETQPTGTDLSEDVLEMALRMASEMPEETCTAGARDGIAIKDGQSCLLPHWVGSG